MYNVCMAFHCMCPKCAIFGDCRLRGVGVVRGVSLPSPIDLTRRPYNTVTVTLPCDRVMALSCTILELVGVD